MPFEIVRNDISNIHVDAIVNAASRFPQVGVSVDSAIHMKAGQSLLNARKEIGYIEPGSAAITPAFNLHAEYVIHAATPTWVDGHHGETILLRRAYDACLNLAAQHQCDSIAFPLLASGNHGFPKATALQVAIASFSSFLLNHEMQVYLVVFGKESLMLSEKLVHNVRSYIDENYVTEYEEKNSRYIESPRRFKPRMRQKAIESVAEFEDCCAPTVCGTAPLSLNDFIMQRDAGFTETLLNLIQKSGQKNSTIYKKANISKQLFSKIINDPNSKPTKATAISLALALELNLEDTRDLIGRAGYALTNSSTFDLIIRYFIESRQFNVIEINIALYEFDQPLLGA